MAATRATGPGAVAVGDAASGAVGTGRAFAPCNVELMDPSSSDRSSEEALRTALLRTLVPVVLLVALASVIDARAALAALGSAHPGWIVAGLALVQFQVVASALRWRWTAARLGQRIGARRAIAEYYLATLANQTLPGGVVGDAARAVRSTDSAPLGTAGLAVAVERVSGQAALLAVTLAGLAAWPALLGDRPASGTRTVLAALGVALALAALVALARRVGPARLRRGADGLGRALRRTWIEDGAWAVQGVASLAIVGSYLALWATSALALGAPLPPAALVTVVPLALLTMLVPISIGGWGLREAASAALWPLAGLAAADGLATSVLYGLVALAGSLPGLVVVLSRRERA